MPLYSVTYRRTGAHVHIVTSYA